MNIRYCVELTAAERCELAALLSAPQQRRARPSKDFVLTKVQGTSPTSTPMMNRARSHSGHPEIQRGRLCRSM